MQPQRMERARTVRIVLHNYRLQQAIAQLLPNLVERTICNQGIRFDWIVAKRV